MYAAPHELALHVALQHGLNYRDGFCDVKRFLVRCTKNIKFF
jgi:hypothetical protein